MALNTSKLAFIGHSQGSLTGAILAGLESSLKAYTLSASGGRIGITLMERQTPAILPTLVSYGILDNVSNAHKMHPLMMLVQLVTEITDPINYARHYVDEPFDNQSRSIFLTTGFNDAQTPKNATYALATAGWIPLVGDTSVPELVNGLVYRGFLGWDQFPVSNNVTRLSPNAATGGLMQFPSGDHFVIYTSVTAASTSGYFLNTAVYGTVPILEPPAK